MNLRHVRKGLLGVNLLLSGLLLWVVYGMVRGDAAPGPGTASKEPVPTHRPGSGRPDASTARRLAVYQEIVGKDIFETTPSISPTAPEPESKEEDIDITRLNVRLMGTMVGDRNAYAVIADGRTRKEDIYRVGDPLQNTVIADIRTDRVILDVDGRKEALVLFPEDAAGKEGVASPAPARRAPRGRPAPRQAPARGGPPVNRLPSR